MIAPPHFWWRPRASAIALLLSPFSLVYGALSGARMRRPPVARAEVPVVCIGNYVVGGAGKTPTALAVARIAIALGRRPGFLTRGYGGKVPTPVLVDPLRHGAAEVGDEALLLAELGPVVVSPDRPKGLPLLAEAGADFIIMDDGFQNPSLYKDLRIVVVDGATGIGNGLVLPAGPLRVALRTQIARTDAAIIVGPGKAGDHVLRRLARAGRPILRARLQPLAHRDWDGPPFLAFAGIGRPEKFFNTLDHAGAPIREVRAFPDHHVLAEEEAQKLLSRAEREGLRLITTTKDYARLSSAKGSAALLRQRTEIFEVGMAFEDERRLAALIETMLRRFVAAPPNGGFAGSDSKISPKTTG
ncbi:tetraacyldisaccharide 4'-kinase [Kaistia algarum]|uniref:tetraacyldisaccharide 4'-kinase n=1 Tax=Kaistia algarum TaxID=2083279 RepID=UPI000CE8D75C|nr:tetraacyldisaccharide 4'-kinase [Kaistia algarum]MCX5512445.1 tetraacyldisaccharide 4'-kinase [Kaistia algarum]PPE80524.1 tetraacyldisaccharide 4'-kinase [Kaistia algarum]